MLKFLKNIFTGSPKVNLKELISKGAVIIDVRTEREYLAGHINNSKNIPLAKLSSSLSKLDRTKPIITCCASGARSASAKHFLISNGFTEVHNGGSWTSLKNL